MSAIGTHNHAIAAGDPNQPPSNTLQRTGHINIIPDKPLQSIFKFFTGIESVKILIPVSKNFQRNVNFLFENLPVYLKSDISSTETNWEKLRSNGNYSSGENYKGVYQRTFIDVIKSLEKLKNSKDKEFSIELNTALEKLAGLGAQEAFQYIFRRFSTLIPKIIPLEQKTDSVLPLSQKLILESAVNSENKQLVKFLLEQKADFTHSYALTSPLLRRQKVSDACSDVIIFLIEHCGNKIVESNEVPTKYLDAAGYCGAPPLVLAITRGNEKVVNELLNAKASLNLENASSRRSDKETVLHHAVKVWSSPVEERLTIFRNLLGATLNDRPLLEAKNSSGQTPFLVAIDADAPLCVLKELHRVGANARALIDGNNVFHIAAQKPKKQPEVFDFLFKIVPDLYQELNSSRLTPLACAFASDNRIAIKFFLQKHLEKTRGALSEPFVIGLRALTAKRDVGALKIIFEYTKEEKSLFEPILQVINACADNALDIILAPRYGQGYDTPEAKIKILNLIIGTDKHLVNKPNSKGRTSFSLAMAGWVEPEVINFLLAAGADPLTPIPWDIIGGIARYERYVNKRDLDALLTAILKIKSNPDYYQIYRSILPTLINCLRKVATTDVHKKIAVIFSLSRAAFFLLPFPEPAPYSPEINAYFLQLFAEFLKEGVTITAREEKEGPTLLDSALQKFHSTPNVRAYLNVMSSQFDLLPPDKLNQAFYDFCAIDYNRGSAELQLSVTIIEAFIKAGADLSFQPKLDPASRDSRYSARKPLSTVHYIKLHAQRLGEEGFILSNIVQKIDNAKNKKTVTDTSTAVALTLPPGYRSPNPAMRTSTHSADEKANTTQPMLSKNLGTGSLPKPNTS